MSEVAGEKIIVTGGAGYIGSHTVVELYQAGYIPVIVDNFSNSERSVPDGIEQIVGTRVKCHEVDCTNKEALANVFQEEGDIVGVVHFAAYKQVGESVSNPKKYFDNNVGSMKSLIAVMNRFGIDNLVFSSSCTVYGQPQILPVDESAPANRSESPYGKTKEECEALLFATKFPRSVILRYFNPIGAHPSAHIGELPKGNPANLIPAITKVVSFPDEVLRINGDTYNTPDGTCVRDYLHVVDLAKAHVKALNWLRSPGANSAEVFNLGMGKGYSVKEILDTFEAVNGIKINTVIGPKRDGDVEQVYANATKANEVLKWQTEMTIEQALSDAWRWQEKLNN